jgi:hypothetical protein
VVALGLPTSGGLAFSDQDMEGVAWLQIMAHVLKQHDAKSGHTTLAQ